MERERTVSFILNGEQKVLEIQHTWTLLYVLREVYNLTGTKYGCGTGDCGACKVLIDMEAVNSCTYPMRKVDGKSIVTIEGVVSLGSYAVVQQSFVASHAIQCGFCTPGMIMCTIGLLAKNGNPTEQEIRAALHPNLCRCTGYVNIVQAVQLAARQLKEVPHGM